MFNQENTLERALRRAATDSAFIPEFYGTLLDSDIYVIGHTGFGGEEGETEVVHAEEGANVHIQQSEYPDGSSVITFFTSLDALRRFIEDEHDYLRLPAREFFQMTLGQDLVLNPASDFGKSFSAFEIGDLLKHGLPRQGEREVVEENTSVLIGQPSDYPHDITSALCRYFETDARVKAAYLVLMHIPDRDEKPGLYVGIECAPEDYEKVCPAAGAVVAPMLSDERILSFCLVDPNAPGVPADYMLKETEPFYHATAHSSESTQANTSASTSARTSQNQPRAAASTFGRRANHALH